MASSRLELLSDFDAKNVLESPSKPFVYGALKADSPQRLSVFDALPISVTENDGRPYAVDCVLFGGGVCNTLDWCPFQSTTDDQVEYLALSCHSKHISDYHIGTMVQGQGLVQIWSVESGVQDGVCATWMCQGIVHDSYVCCYLQWCPNPLGLMNEITIAEESLGLLAVALGNGETCIVSVPKPTKETRFIRIQPWVVLTREQLSGSLVSCLDWHPNFPHDLLLLGCWDGTVSMWTLPYERRQSAEQLLQHRINLLALRRVVWLKAPNDAFASTDAIYQNYFCSIGHSGHFSIWDRRNMFQPVLDWTLTRWWLLDADVSHRPLAVYCAFEDASIRQLPLEMQGFTDQLDQSVFHVYTGLNKGAVHAICCSPCNALVAYGGEDGEIAVLVKENVGDTRYRKPHVCAGSMKYDAETGILHIQTAQECMKIGGVYIGGAMFATNKPKHQSADKPNGAAYDYQTIQCLKFSPNGNSTTWLAAGSVTGLVRILRISE